MASAVAHHLHDTKHSTTLASSIRSSAISSLSSGLGTIPMADRALLRGQPSQSPEVDDGDQDERNSYVLEAGNGGASSNSDGPTRKRRRSRKGLDKRFECTAEGCGKSYSRAEHLYVGSRCNVS